MAEIGIFLKALRTVAENPLALVGYTLIVACWLVLGLRVRRNRNLLRHLGQLSESDRLTALESEMGVVKLRQGVSPEQWLRANVHRYLFLAFVILCVAVILLFAMAAGTRVPPQTTALSGSNAVPSVPVHTEFREVYKDWRLELGAPVGEGKKVRLVHESFLQSGRMLWLDADNQCYVLAEKGNTWFAHTGLPAPGKRDNVKPAPKPGQRQPPRGGLLRVWEQLGLRKTLGWSLGYCEYEDSVYQQRFEKGKLLGPIRAVRDDDFSGRVVALIEGKSKREGYWLRLPSQTVPACKQ